MKFNISDLVSAFYSITQKQENAVIVDYDERTDHYRIMFVENGRISLPLWYSSDELTLL
jgi:hypothetical protein